MSTTDDDLKNFLVNDVGISEETVDDALMIAGWAAAAYSGYGYLVVAYEFLDKFFGSSGGSSNQAVEAKLQKILANQDADKLSEVINDLKNAASAIDNAWMATRAYGHSPSQETRDIASGNLTDSTGLNVSLLSLLEGKVYRFVPQVYATKNAGPPAWVNGAIRWGSFYNRFTVYSFSGNSTASSQITKVFQLYQQPNVPIDPDDELPAPLLKNHDRWDGLLCLPLIVNGLPVWQTTLSVLEPFYRLSGVWVDHIDGMFKKMLDFSINWLSSMLWIREMPSKSELEADNVFLTPVNPFEKSSAGFYNWPCGVVDPIMGIEVINQTWWKADNKVEMWTDEQAGEFRKQRLLQHANLQNKNGFNAFLKIAGSIGKLRIPPTFSPSLKVHPKLIKFEHPSSGTPALVMPTYKDVTDPGGSVWTGQVIRSSVIVTAPISVQPNPAPAEPHARRALSNTVFGYAITVTPTGGKEQKVADWPLRISDASPSLYHKANGDRRDVPYKVEQNFGNLAATTWETITDGPDRDRGDEDDKHTVAFRVTVTVADQELPRIPEDDFNISGTPWNLHGAIWVRIEADKEANLGRSFELTIKVKEIAAVDAKGYPQGHEKFSGKFKTYSLKMPVPVDICRVVVPSNYFYWLAPKYRWYSALQARALGFRGQVQTTTRLSSSRCGTRSSKRILPCCRRSYRMFAG